MKKWGHVRFFFVRKLVKRVVISRKKCQHVPIFSSLINSIMGTHFCDEPKIKVIIPTQMIGSLKR